jgi:hypothetical protein
VCVKKLCIKITFISYNFPKKESYGERKLSRKEKIPDVGDRSLEACLASVRGLASAREREGEERGTTVLCHMEPEPYEAAPNGL